VLSCNLGWMGGWIWMDLWVDLKEAGVICTNLIFSTGKRSWQSRLYQNRTTKDVLLGKMMAGLLSFYIFIS